jgi:PBP1b-binding outer membrane lipoprotein LpoB
MNRHVLHILLIAVFLTSCKPESKGVDKVKDTVEVVQEDTKISSIGITLSLKAKQETDVWLTYQMVQSKINGYYSVTKSQALQNARELADLVKNASDSIKIEKLDRPDIKIRFNVLYNHALRLDDMSTINNISDDDVMNEVASILDGFSAINEKINVIYKIEHYEKELKITSEKPEVLEIDTSKKVKTIKKSIKKAPQKRSRIGIPLLQKEGLKKKS